MNARKILFMTVVVLSPVGLVQAKENSLHGTIDVTYLSSYIFRGVDLYAENHSAIQPSIDIDLYGTGLALNVFSSRANKSGFEDYEELRVGLRYSNSLFKGQRHTTAYTAGWTYYGYPDMPKKGGIAPVADVQEAYAVFAWPRIFNIDGLVPNYTVVCLWPAQSDSAASKNGGWVHVLGLGYDLAVPPLLPDTKEQLVHLSADVVYNGGVGSPTIEHDWSHAVFGVSTEFKITDNLSFVPGFYYQSSWEDSVNTQDEMWCKLSMQYKF